MSTKTKILIVDDSVEILSAIRLFLEMKDYEVCSVISYNLLKSSLEYFNPEIIILDIMLGGILDGRVICKIIKSQPSTQHIPILLMSGDPDRLVNYEECNADDVIEKPFNLKGLEEKIVSIIRKKKFLSEELPDLLAVSKKADKAIHDPKKGGNLIEILK